MFFLSCLTFFYVSHYVLVLFLRFYVRPGLQDKDVIQKQLLIAEERIKVLEEKLKDAEDDADGKSEEVRL